MYVRFWTDQRRTAHVVLRLNFEQSREKEENTWTRFLVDFKQNRETPHIENPWTPLWKTREGYYIMPEKRFISALQLRFGWFLNRETERRPSRTKCHFERFETAERNHVHFDIEIWAGQRKTAHVEVGLFLKEEEKDIEFYARERTMASTKVHLWRFLAKETERGHHHWALPFRAFWDRREKNRRSPRIFGTERENPHRALRSCFENLPT